MELTKLTFPEACEQLRTLVRLRHCGSLEHEIGTGFLTAGSRLPVEGVSHHPRHEVSIILSGHLRTTVEDETIDLREGDIVSIETASAQCTEVIEDTRLIYMFFDDEIKKTN